MAKVMILLFLVYWFDAGFCQCVTSQYDYIIVGAGTAGCVLANRLTRDPQNRVLVLERGSDPGSMNDIPGAAEILAQIAPFAHRYAPLKSDNYCRGLAHQRCKNIMGWAAGGTSAVNAMLYTRGVAQDYDRWVKEHGAEGWGWKDILPYFRSNENFKPKQNPGQQAYGTQGESILTYSEAPLEEVSIAFQEAGTNLTQKYVIDGQTREGITQPITTIDEFGRRHDAYNAYIEPIRRERSNLKLITDALVTKINIKGKRAVGVDYELAGRIACKAEATKEVILAAGAFESPHLLMLSGIGPKGELDKHNIDVIADLPVGHNLMDHIGTFGITFITSENTPWNTLQREIEGNAKMAAGLAQYSIEGKGPWSLPAFLQRFGFVNIFKQPEGAMLNKEICKHDVCETPNIEYLLFPFTASGPPPSFGRLNALVFNLAEDEWESVYVPKLGVDSFTISPSLLYPLSRGNITLASSDIYDDPLINLNYFGHPDDMKTLIAGIKFALRMARTKPFQDLNAKLWDIPVRGCEQHKMWSDDYLECVARYYTITYHHYSGTCKMGRAKGDPSAVVDPELKVIGMDNLRVVDVSILPDLMAGHTQAVAMAIGSKAADLILGKNSPSLNHQ